MLEINDVYNKLKFDINYYTNKKWSEAESYELCLTSSELGVEGTAKAIIDYVKLKESIKREDRKI